MDLVYRIGWLDVPPGCGTLLGLRLEIDKLYIEPCIPSDWASYNIHYRYRETTYRITVTQLHDSDTKLAIMVDGTECKDKFIRLVDDHQEHLAAIKVYREKI
jgi:cyclic beta-1,2-glucan synthetase